MADLKNFELDERAADTFDTLTIRRTMTVEIDKDLHDDVEVTVVVRLQPLLTDLVYKAMNTSTAHSKLHDGDIDLGITTTPTLRAIRQHRKALDAWYKAYRGVSFDARNQYRQANRTLGFYSPEADAAAAAAEAAWEAEHPRPVFTPKGV